MKLQAVALFFATALWPAWSQDLPERHAGEASAPAAAAPQPARAPDRAAAYYHYGMAHIYEELVTVYGRSEFINKAIEEFKLALEYDPGSEFLNAELAGLYARTGRIRDAVLEAQEILKRDPDNLEAHKLLSRIYLRSLGDLQSGVQSQEVLRLATEQLEAVVRLEPRDADNHLLLGRLYMLGKELLKAESAFQKALELEPGSEDAVTNLAYLYSEEGDMQRAIRTLEGVPEAARSAKLYSAMGFTYEREGDHKNAIRAYQRAVELDRDNLDSLRGLAQNLYSDGQSEAALEQYRNLAEADPRDVQALLRMAEIQRRSGKFDQALENLKHAAELVPDSLEIPYNLALVEEARGNFTEAEGILRGLLEKTLKADGNYTAGERNNRAIFLERLGSLYRDQQKTKQALEVLAELLALGDDYASRAYQQIIETHRSARDWKEATRVAQEAADKLPEDRSLQFQLAGQLADQGEGEAALARVQAFLKGGPEDREVYITLAQVNSRLKRWKEAEEAVAQAEKLSTKPAEKQFLYFLLGSMYERQKKFDRAEAMFQRILQSDSESATTLNYLGYMLADRGVRLEEALGYIKKAVELDPQNGAYLDSLGWVYYKMGNHAQAEEYLGKALEREPNDPTIHDHLGDVYARTGRLKLAAAQWERALAEWNRSAPPDVDAVEVAKVQKKLDNAKVRLARQGAVQK